MFTQQGQGWPGLRGRGTCDRLSLAGLEMTNRRSAMTKIRDEVLAANEAYAKDFDPKAKLPMPPARRFAILTCMDARLDPAKFAGLSRPCCRSSRLRLFHAEGKSLSAMRWLFACKRNLIHDLLRRQVHNVDPA
jgi:hypothetical protein